MSVSQTIKNQIIMALQNARFPIASPEELLASFPQGAKTTCKADGVEVTAGQAGKLFSPKDFPFESAEEIAEAIISRASF